jgi:DNA (cytosine-5)-methyltransferase 1
LKKHTVIDLFCGAGGLSKGFLDAGYKILVGVDFDDAALKTFVNNHGQARAVKLDLNNHDNIEILVDIVNEIGESIDVLVGGPPCQGFSLAGKREEEDERNSLYLAMVKTASILKPKVVVLENVPGMLTLYDGKAKQRILQDFEELGYKMNVKVMYAAEYGVPQIRKRAFFVGLLNCNDKFEYPEPLLFDEKFVSCEDAISDLPSLENDENYLLDVIREYNTQPNSEYQEIMRKNSSHVFNHYPTKHTRKTIDHIALIPDGGKYTDLPPDLIGNFKYRESLHRYNSKKPSLTIDTGHRTHFHYKYNRIPTIRENARLQSFPDDFIFFGSKQQQYKQVGNAVPPLLGKVLANKLKEYLDYE